MALVPASALAAFFLVTSGGLRPPDPPSPTHTSTGKPMAERLGGGPDNLARIAPGLYRGARPDHSSLESLKKLGIKTVINLRFFHGERVDLRANGIEPVDMPLYAALGSSAPREETVRRFFEIVLDPERQPVYFHCKYGKDRTGTMAALYRIEIDGWTPEEAIEELHAFGYHSIYDDLEDFVRDYRPRGFSGR